MSWEGDESEIRAPQSLSQQNSQLMSVPKY